MVDFAPAYLGIIKEFNWRHVVILLQDENLYTMVTHGVMIIRHSCCIAYNEVLFLSFNLSTDGKMT